MRIDVARSLRRLRPDGWAGALARRNREALPFVGSEPTAGPPLLLDTTVYIDALQGRLPSSVNTLMRLRTLQHHALCLAELAHAIGRADPAHPRTAASVASVVAVVEAVPEHRLDTGTSPGVAVEAGILSGLVFRLGGFQPGQEVAAQTDATLFLHALERGYEVLTRNVRDYDFMLQIVPAGRVWLYERG